MALVQKPGQTPPMSKFAGVIRKKLAEFAASRGLTLDQLAEEMKGTVTVRAKHTTPTPPTMKVRVETPDGFTLP